MFCHYNFYHQVFRSIRPHKSDDTPQPLHKADERENIIKRCVSGLRVEIYNIIYNQCHVGLRLHTKAKIKHH